MLMGQWGIVCREHGFRNAAEGLKEVSRPTWRVDLGDRSKQAAQGEA